MITIQTIDGFIHGPFNVLPNGLPDLSSVASQNTRNALLAGVVTPYVAPIAIEQIESNGSNFRALLAQNAAWLNWGASIPSVSYTNLTIAASQDNWIEAQLIYNAVKASYPVPNDVSQWQAIADSNGIPILF